MNNGTESSKKARSALDLITRHGKDDDLIDSNDLQYGLDNGLFTQKAIDYAHEEFLQMKARRTQK